MKNFKQHNLIKLILALSIIVVACTERIDIELENTFTRCIIFGQITTDTTEHKITIARSGDYFNDTPPQGISGALVTISDGETILPLTEDPDEPGTYFTQADVYGIPGKTYTLFVDNVDLLGDGNLTSYEATTEMNPVAEADSIKVTYRTDWQGWVIQAYAQDPPETKDFYKFLIYKNGELFTDSLRNINYTDDSFFDGNYTHGVVVYYFSDEETFAQGDTITAAFCGITKDYYKYLIEARITASPSIPLFSAPPANPRTNLSNGAIGYFTAYSISRATTVVEEDD